MNKVYNVKVVEKREITVGVEASSLVESEKKAQTMYESDDVFNDEYRVEDSVEFFGKEVDPLSEEFWNNFSSHYLYNYVIEMFKAMDIKNSEYKNCVFEIMTNLDESIGLYDESYFDSYIYDEGISKKPFKDYKKGVYDKEAGFYRTKEDGMADFIVEIQF